MSILLSILLAANAFDQNFDRAAQAYDDHDFPEAIELYEQLVAQGVVEPVVFYNLGNAYYRSGAIAPAIVNYERALQLDPNMEAAQANLASSVRQTDRELTKPQPPDWEQSLLFWHYNLRKEISLRLAVFSWFLLWILLGIRQIRAFPYLRRSALLAAVAVVLFGVSWWAKSTPQQLAVATQYRVPVRYGTTDSETVRFELYEGDRVVVDRRDEEWSRVETAGGERGWTRNIHLMFVGPPYGPPPEKLLHPTASKRGEGADALADEDALHTTSNEKERTATQGAP